MPKNKVHNENYKKLTQKLRKELTDEERKLWYCFIRYLPVKFLRQHIIGDYIVDFYCASYKLVIELDGIQHYTEEGIIKDRARDEFLSSLGLTVLRYTNIQIHNQFESVCMDIKSRLNID